MTRGNYCAVYDFELMPYALGDVLTWNVQTAIRCEESDREHVDVFVCMDERYPASIYQKDTVTADNCALFFNELFGAFGTHPKLGNVFLYRQREQMLERLRERATDDAANRETLADYERALANRHDETALIEYFTKYIHLHERINAFAKAHGRIPLLRPSMGCEPDVAGLLEKRFAGKRVVPIHMRHRRLDPGYGGEHTYSRDSDFLEWYEFLRNAEKKHPEVQFVLMGRVQEKPIELLRLPNVLSLRALGLGLGHELTLMLKSDLFMGTSSGFAAMANFSETPYFITKMTRESCNAYRIEPGTERLPFATDRQILVYEPETRELLMRLLERGLGTGAPRGGGPVLSVDPAIDVRSWEGERSLWLHPGATTSRFFADDNYSDKETAFLVWPRVKEARLAWRRGLEDRAWEILLRIEANFPRMCAKFPEYLRLKERLARKTNEKAALRATQADLESLAAREKSDPLSRTLKRYLLRGFPVAMELKRAWRRKHRIPRKLRQLARRYAFRRNES
ncbi:MAG: hypothetical protein HY661_23035 [Betaproteobacteria bacterium]|nr:hypothetical protein [Betaproteobacteria bacterium]